MYGNRPAVELLLLAALLLAPSASAAVGTYSGRDVVSHSAAKEMRDSARLHTDMASATLTRRLEDEVAPEVTWAASVLGESIGNQAFERNRPVCPHTGSCAGQSGKPYTPQTCYKDLYRSLVGIGSLVPACKGL
jgi:hypothetical protein